VPLLFALHVACMAPMLPLGISAISTVRQRLIPAAETPAGATTGWRKRRAEWLVIRHFLTSAGAFYAAGAGIVSIWLHKNSLGRAHLTSVHSWLGVATWAAWLAAYVSAQPNVWKDQWKDRRFSLWGNKRWLWASAGHRQFGTLAFASSLGAYCTGLLGWRTLDRRISIPCIGAVALIAKNVLNERSTHEAAQAMRRMVLSPVRASRALSSRVRSGPPSMMSAGGDEDISPELAAKLAEMQARNQRNGQVVLSFVLILVLWVFTLPPDIRRSREDLAGWAPLVLEHYQTCGATSGVPCVQLDLTIDPESVAQFQTVVDTLGG